MNTLTATAPLLTLPIHEVQDLTPILLATEPTYLVNDVYPCIQGEGAQAGTPMILVRLHGCAVGCPWCDTKETWVPTVEQRVTSLATARRIPSAYVERTLSELLSDVIVATVAERWVMLTGGEPADQHIAPLITALQYHGYKVNLETSGTAHGHQGSRPDWTVVSPKLGMPGGRALDHDVLDAADEIKLVVGKPADIDLLTGIEIDLRSNGTEGLRYTVQPITGGDGRISPRALALCVEACRLHGWHLSVQMHKILNQR